MFDQIYVEEEAKNYPLTETILSKYPKAHIVDISFYGEVFNSQKQNFRIQKKRPKLILAKKRGKLVHKTPPDYALFDQENFYFSPMLNCIYDCKYCFLQGMFRSANYVVFVNTSDFKDAIDASGKGTYFSGYDTDSLALEFLSGFIDSFVPFFSSKEGYTLELRTKSVSINPLLKHPPSKNIITAYTLTPDCIQKEMEAKTPSLQKRLEAMKTLQEKGYEVAIRFDPMIYLENYEEIYPPFFEKVFTLLGKNLHSVTAGSFRMPASLFKKVRKLYPKERLFAGGIEDSSPQVTYDENLLRPFLKTIYDTILHYVPREIFFPCQKLL